MLSTRVPILLTLTTFIITTTLGEIFTSTHDVKRVFRLESNLVDALSKYLVKEETRLGRIRRYLEEYEAVKYDLANAYYGIGGIGPGGNADSGGFPSLLDGREQHENFHHSMSQFSTPTMDGESESAFDLVSGNPLHTFHLMKRLTVYWKHIDSTVVKEEWDGVLLALFGEGGRLSPTQTVPGDEDLQGAAQALVRLHEVYGLNTTATINGDILGIQSATGLSAQDCLYMGKHSFNIGLYSQSIDWFGQAYTLAGLEGNQTISQEQVMQFLNTAIQMQETAVRSQNNDGQGKVQHNSTTSNEATENEKNILENEEPSELTRETDVLPLPDTIQDPNDGLFYNSPHNDLKNFQNLCRGKKIMDPLEEAKLHCRLDHRNAPYLYLMPAKVEEHHLSGAGLLSFHDVLTSREIEEMKRLAYPVLSRAKVSNENGGDHMISDTRTSKTAWLADSQYSFVSSLSRRIEYLTGLSTSGDGDSEMLQVANYGIGGHYNPHHDYLFRGKGDEMLMNYNQRELEIGDRIATFMFYLNDVVRGGATAFPRLGTAVWPTKGSAAFWFNLKRSGTENPHTLHGGCPVVHGSKWVSNKWIRENGQFRQRKCTENSWE